VQPFQTAGGVQQRDVAILNEQQATLLVTFMRNIGVVKDFKVRLVKAFYELAQQVRNPGAALTRLDLIKLALDSEERRIAAEAQCQALAQKVEYMTPRAAFADAVAGAVNSITIQEFSKMIGWGPNSLFRRLRTDGILRADNLPMEPYRRRGYFDVKERTRRLDDDGSRAVYTVTMVTGKGQLWLANRYAAGVMQQALQVQPPRSAACA
jgi:anti-repressor protein